MPALLKLSRSIENLRDSFRSQPPTYEKKKNYKYKRFLGKGTFGKVLFAVWHDPGQLGEKRSLERRYPRKPSRRDVALKVVKKSNLKRGDKDVVISEVNILKRLNHKNVMQFYEFFESCNNYYISFEYAAGGELFDRIKQRGGKFTEIDAKSCVRSILHGVEYLHANGILHHDMKPENILLRSKAPDADIILADFGAARHVDYPDQLLYCDTGTYDYSPPEIFTHEGHGTKLDMWAVGVITHALLSGMMPFPNQTLSILKQAILRCELAFEGRYWEKVSSTAKEFICALIHADQITRLSASEALAHPWLSGESDVKANAQFKSSESSLTKANWTENDNAAVVGVFPTKSIPDLPGLREHYSQVARARWRIAIGSAIAVNRLREGGSRAASRRRRTLELLDQHNDSEREREYDEYACDFESEFANMSQVSLAMASTGSLTTYAERKSASLEVEANSPENLRELEKLVASRRLGKEDGKDVDVSDSSRSSFSASSYSSPSPEPSEPLEPESKSEPSEQKSISTLATLPPPPTRPIPAPPFPRLNPKTQAQQHRIRSTLRPPSRSRGWSSSFSSSSSTESGSSLSTSSAISASPTTSSGGTYTSHSTAATSVMSMSLVSTRSNSMCADECDCPTPVPAADAQSTLDTKSKPPINSMKHSPSQRSCSHSRAFSGESRREFGIIDTTTKSLDVLNESQNDASGNSKTKTEGAPFDPENVLDMYIGVRWRTSLSQISPELETSLRSFKERW
ncbi:CMK2_3 [Sanghuangporus vaninii]